MTKEPDRDSEASGAERAEGTHEDPSTAREETPIAECCEARRCRQDDTNCGQYENTCRQPFMNARGDQHDEKEQIPHQNDSGFTAYRQSTMQI